MTLRPRRRPARPIAILLLVPLLAGCGGLLSDAPQRKLYRVSPTLAFAAPLPHVAAQLVVAMPTAPAGLDNDRIALSRAPDSLDYFAGVQWTDRAPFLLQSALVDGFAKSLALPTVGPESLGLRADFALDVAIDNFEAVYNSPGGPPHILVRLRATLVGIPERRIVAQHSVSREANAAGNTVPEVVQAFDEALGGAIEDVVTWTVSDPALSGRHASVLSRTRFVHAGGGGRS